MLKSPRLVRIEASIPRMTKALPDLPMQGTVLVRLMRLTTVMLTEHFEPHFRKSGLSENAFHLLCLLLVSEDGCASPSELSELVGTSRANVTRLVDQLEMEGLIERKRVPRDGRRLIVSITALGRTRASEMVPLLTQPILSAFGALSADEQGQLADLLRVLIQSIGE